MCTARTRRNSGCWSSRRPNDARRASTGPGCSARSRRRNPEGRGNTRDPVIHGLWSVDENGNKAYQPREATVLAAGDEEPNVLRVLAQVFAHSLCQAVEAAPHVDGLRAREDADVGRNHGAAPTTSMRRRKAAASACWAHRSGAADAMTDLLARRPTGRARARQEPGPWDGYALDAHASVGATSAPGTVRFPPGSPAGDTRVGEALRCPDEAALRRGGGTRG